jgi:hypothetical protein
VTHDSVDTISKATGIPRQDMLDIWESVKKNSAALEGCLGRHDFQTIDPTKKFGARYKCSKCQGEIDATGYHWYTIGLAHGSTS